MASVDNLSSPALWLIEQLSRPLDANEEHTIIYGREEIIKEIGSAEAESVEEYATLCRVLAWREKEYQGKILELELIEASRLKTRLNMRITSGKTVLPEVESNTRKLWEQILSALELPSTRQLLSQQAVLTYVDSKKANIQVSSNWFAMVQSRLRILEKAVAAVTGNSLSVQLVPKEFPETTRAVEEIPEEPSVSHGIIISLYDPSKDKTKILSDINAQDNDADDINLLVKAWTHHGGSLDDLSGVPSYLQTQ